MANGNVKLPTGTTSGVVARLQQGKGWGFINADGKDYFFHYSALKGVRFEELTEGDAVTFLPGESESGKGPRAENVRRA